MKQVFKRFLSLALAMLMVLTLLPGMTTTAWAATSVGGLDDKDIGLSYEHENVVAWEAEATTVTGTAKGTTMLKYIKKAGASTLTITNTKDKPATLSFDYTLQLGKGTAKVNGGAVTAGGKFSEVLQPNTSIKVYIKSEKGEGNTTKITLTNVQLVADVSATVTFQPAQNGSYTVDGKAITEAYTNTQSSKVAYQVVATPAAGYQFMGWYDETHGEYLSTNATESLHIEENCTVTARFVSKDAALFETGGQMFADLGEAIAYAQSKNQTKITLVGDGTISGSYTIPSGITLLIPFDAAKTCYTTTPAPTTSQAGAKVFRTLTMSEGASLTVNGAISVGGQYFAAAGNGQGRIVGPYGCIKMESGSTIDVKSGASLYAWGFISGSGAVTVQPGGSVYEWYQILDFRGGTNSSKIGNKVFPFNQYAVQNVEVPLTLHAGASETVYSGVNAMGGIKPTSIPFIADNGMFKLTSGTLTKAYDGATDRIIYTIAGVAELNSLSLKLAGISVNSKDYVLPLTNNMTINLAEGGKLTINQTAALLPGVEVSIAEGAELMVSSGTNIYIYDVAEWGGYCGGYSQQFIPAVYAPGRTGSRPPLADVKVDVNGKLTANGGIYTTQSGADICSSEGTGVYNQQGAPGKETMTYQYDGGPTKHDIPITAAKLHNADGTYTETKTAKAGDVINYVSGVWGGEEPVELTVTFEANGSAEYPVEGTMAAQTVLEKTDAELTPNAFTREGYNFKGWNTVANGSGTSYADGATVNLTENTTLYAQWEDNHSLTTVINKKDATCTEDGYTGDTVCAICGKEITKGETIQSKGHTEVIDARVEPTCTEPGKTEGKHCSVCNAIIVAQTEIPATGHTEVIDPAVEPTCTESGKTEGKHCSVCSAIIVAQTEIPANGHTEVTDPAVAPTCTKTGLTEGKHCSVCGKVLVEQQKIDAKGHTEETIPGKAPTCTETGLTDGVRCSVCGVVLTPQSEIPATGHSWDEGKVTTAATCENAGVKTYTCTVCQETKTEAITATGHTSVSVPGKPATCTETGLTAGTKCSVCDAILSGMEEIPATGHNWNAGEITTAPTCKDKGVMTYTCTNEGCDATKTEKIPALGHKEETIPSKAATCTETGLTAGTKCSVCGTVIKAQEVIPAKGHTPETIPGKAATCTEPGLTDGTKCSVCGTVIKAQEVIPATGHKLEIRNAVEATLTTPGYTGDKYCTVCDELIEKGTEIPKTGAHITWVIDGKVVAEEDYLKGTMPSFKGSTDKNPDDNYRYTFTGWSPEVVVAEEDVIYTAQYSQTERVFYTITFDGNGGTGKMDPQTFEVGIDAQLQANAFTRENYEFTGWNTAADGSGATYADEGAILELTGDMTLYAQWQFWNGWFTDVNGKQYYKDGELQKTGWTVIDGNTYYLDTGTGYAATGIVKLTPENAAKEAHCVFDANGVFQKNVNGVYTVGEDTYWLNNGIIEEYAGLKRVVKEDDEVNYYYFGEDGKAVKGGDYPVEKNNSLPLPCYQYRFDANGIIEHDKDTSKKGIAMADSGTDHYFIDGIKVGEGLIRIDGKYYYARTSNGEIIKDRRYWISKTNDIYQIPTGIYYFDTNGVMQIDGFVTVGDGTYYYANCELVRGFTKIGKDYYFFNAGSGKMYKDATMWVPANSYGIEPGMYYFGAEGKMVIPDMVNGEKKIVEVGGKLYFTIDGARMKNGLYELDGEYYYVNYDGTLAVKCSAYVSVSESIESLDKDGWYGFGADGKLVKTGFVTGGDDYTYYYNNGKRAKGFTKIGEDFYLFNGNSGKMYKDANMWVAGNNDYGIAGGMHYFGTDGKMTKQLS